jgi:predicted HAD superfamily Cof-like phosphohydrolase
MSNFEKVIEFNYTFDIQVNDKPVLDIFTKDPPLVKYRLDLIKEEILELTEAISQKDIKETLDALCDILYVVYGMACTFGINLNVKGDLKENLILNIENFDKLDIMLMQSKLDTLIEYIDAQSLENIYQVLFDIVYLVYDMSNLMGLDVDKGFNIVHESNMSKSCSSLQEALLTCESYKQDVRYDSPEYKLSKNNKYIIFNKSTKKILKNINYKAANFDELLK